MRFSIITPVYNSSRFLPGLYADLKEQYKRYSDFEWVLIDDCSTDNSRDEIAKIRNSDHLFPIKALFLDKNHYGTLNAITASEAAEGDYIIFLDADDFLSENGLTIFHNLIEKYQHNDGFVGVCGRCVDFKGNFIGTPFAADEVYSNELYVRHVLKIKGEMFQCTRREVIREYFKDVKPGYTNGWAWSRISQKYSWVYTNQVVRRYYTDNPTSATHTPVSKYLYNRTLADMIYMSTMKKYIMKDPVTWFLLAVEVATKTWLCKKIYVGKNQPWFVQVTLLLLIPLGSILAVLKIIKNGRKRYRING